MPGPSSLAPVFQIMPIKLRAFVRMRVAPDLAQSCGSNALPSLKPLQPGPACCCPSVSPGS